MLVKSICMIVVIMIYSLFKLKKSLHMLQQNLYNENNRYLRWIWKNKKKELFTLDIYGIPFSILFLFSIESNVVYYFIGLIIVLYVVCAIKMKNESKTDQNKKPLVYTARIKRLIFTSFILYALPILGACLCKYKVDFVYVEAILAYLSYYVLYLALIINTPVEKIIYKYYESSAKNKLRSMTELKMIGITGSYGKTSSKNVLAEVLGAKYNVLATPKSINTFNGLMIIINNKLSKFDDVFIAEMGAYVKGEINGLCKLVNPKYGIITSIGTAHLETFGSEKDIQEGKMELIEYLPKDGVGVLNIDDPKQKSYKIKNPDHCKILWVGIDDKDEVDVRATNIKCSSEGTTFDCIFKGDKKKYSFQTKMLGKHNVYNIISALALGVEFGIKIEKLQQAVKRLKPVEHRLEIKKFANFYQIDDAYNSNPAGAKGALDVLEMIKGYKVVVTPGMIELGDKEEYYNKEFGKQIAKVADQVILVGKKQTKPIYEGLKESKFDMKKVEIINDVRDSYTMLNKLNVKKDVYALYENDLPDIYLEK